MLTNTARAPEERRERLRLLPNTWLLLQQMLLLVIPDEIFTINALPGCPVGVRLPQVGQEFSFVLWELNYRGSQKGTHTLRKEGTVKMGTLSTC